MKKYVVGIFAVVLAIGFSAFTSVPKKAATLETPYFWYHVDANQTDGPVINGGGKITKSQALAMEYTDCPDQGADFCLYGSLSNSVPDNSSLGTPAADQAVRFDQQ